MSQNSYRLSWTFEEVDAKLKNIMRGIVATPWPPPRSTATRVT